MLRLDRMLVTLGKGSRSEMQKAIRGGRVRVNGRAARPVRAGGGGCRNPAERRKAGHSPDPPCDAA